MPNSPAAKKYLRQNEKRRLLNRSQRSTLRTHLKKFRTLMSSEPTQDEADKAFRQVAKVVDQAAAKHLIHSNKADRTKSRLAALKKSVFTDK